jgi:hypothetical protein
MKDGACGGVLAKRVWVMSPTSYRAAPPRTEWRRENLNHSAILGKGPVNQAAHCAHRKHSAWDQMGDQSAFGAQRPPQAEQSSPPALPSHAKPRQDPLLMSGREKGPYGQANWASRQAGRDVPRASRGAYAAKVAGRLSIPLFTLALVAQSEEPPLCKWKAAGSTPVQGSIPFPPGGDL